MNDSYKARLVLFSNTFPYGMGESFLAEEVPFLAKQFYKITIFPLYCPGGRKRALPANVDIASPLLPFDHKYRIGYLKSGLFNTAPFFFATKEFFRAMFGRNIKLEYKHGKKPSPAHKKAGIIKRLQIFFNYFLMLRTILSRKKLVKEIIRECSFADKIYFYWGDKSAMLIPFLKKLLRPEVEIMPVFCVRFHGSDLYEGVKGYLPFRNQIMAETDFALPVSYNGMEYITHNYNPCPKNIEVWHLGSAYHNEDFANLKEPSSQSFNIISCSNVIPLKRTGLTIKALELLCKDKEASEQIKQRGFYQLTYTHFGGGVMLQSLKEKAEKFNSEEKFLESKFIFNGTMPHCEIMAHYKNYGADLFILVSESEGIPVSIMEAMSYGIPVIASNVGGVSELFHNCPLGYLVGANITAQELKKQILDFILLPTKAQMQMRHNAYANWKEKWNANNNYERFAEELFGSA